MAACQVIGSPGASFQAGYAGPAGRSLDELQKILGDRQAPYYEHEVMAA